MLCCLSGKKYQEVLQRSVFIVLLLGVLFSNLYSRLENCVY